MVVLADKTASPELIIFGQAAAVAVLGTEQSEVMELTVAVAVPAAVLDQAEQAQLTVVKLLLRMVQMLQEQSEAMQEQILDQVAVVQIKHLLPAELVDQELL
jgi:putative NIF3 family GTP cyclohydrolase 1 type 2